MLSRSILEVVPRGTVCRSIDARASLPRGLGIERRGRLPRTCSTWNVLAENLQRIGVPRETSCILCAILLTSATWGAFGADHRCCKPKGWSRKDNHRG